MFIKICHDYITVYHRKENKENLVCLLVSVHAYIMSSGILSFWPTYFCSYKISKWFSGLCDHCTIPASSSLLIRAVEGQGVMRHKSDQPGSGHPATPHSHRRITLPWLLERGERHCCGERLVSTEWPKSGVLLWSLFLSACRLASLPLRILFHIRILVYLFRINELAAALCNFPQNWEIPCAT